MASTEPLLIICAEPKIHKPKPKRINKKSNIFQYNKKSNNYNRHLNHRPQRNNYEQKKNKNYLHEDKNEMCFNLDLISLEEIENDFKLIKSKSEEIEVQRELINLMKRASDESYRNESYKNFQRIKRPQNPFCKNIE